MERSEIIKLVEECNEITKKFREIVSRSPAINDNGEPMITKITVINADFSSSILTMPLYRATPIQINDYIQEIKNIADNYKEILFPRITIDLSNLYVTAYLNIGGDLPNIKFNNTVFNYLCEFRTVDFNNFSDFRNTHFNHGVSFEDTKFKLSTIFDDAVFTGKVTIEETKFYQVSFHKAVFNSHVKFIKSSFNMVGFNDTQFKSTTSFIDCTFEHPPAFHQALLHDDTTFISSKFDNSFKYLAKQYFTKENAEADRMAYMRLRQHMAKASNTIYENMFSEYEQQSQRAIYWYDGKYFNWFISSFYKIISQYGESPFLPVAWWFGILTLFSIVFSQQPYDMVAINPALIQEENCTAGLWVNHTWLGLCYSAQNLTNPLSLFSTDVLFYPKTSWASLLAHIESFLGIIIVTLWIFALKRRFQKGE